MTLLMAALAALAALAGSAESARILAVLPMPAKSHLITFTALTRALAERGHQVTLVCAYPQSKNHPNQKVVAIGDRVSATEAFNASAWLQDGTADSNLWTKIADMHLFGPLGSDLTQYTLDHPEMRKILEQPAGSYDAIIAEVFFAQEVFLGLGYKFQAPVIAIHSHGDIVDINYAVGAAVAPSYKPYPYYLDIPDEMNMRERAANTFFTFYHLYLKWFHEYPHMQELLDKYFPGSPPLVDLLFNVSLTILNSHHSLCYPAPNPPNVVFAGGMHINRQPKQLPKSLKEFMDGAKDGVVYFSFGTLLKASDMTEQQKTMFLEAFASLKQKVLMKWNADPPANLPKNVRLEEWLPQDEILAHPNLRVFITHGGLLGTQEAVYHGVPVIGIPRFADQNFNVKLARRKGYGLVLDFHSLSKELIASTVREVIDNPKYAEAAKRLSRLFREQPISPVENGVFWVEHVIKHGGDHLRPASLRLHWYQNALLDLLAIALVPLLGVACVCLCLCKRRRTSPVAVLTKQTKKNN